LHGDIADNLAMPWKATDAMKERVNFVLDWERIALGRPNS
jgi:hypothetical protein